MLSGEDFWHLVERILPVYIILLMGYALTRLDVIQRVHAPGIGRWVSLIAVPAYVFDILAFNDPYAMSLQLIGADCLQKFLALFIACLWWKFSKFGSIDGVISFFMLSTLPNTVLVGDSLLQPLYGESVHVRVVSIIFLQSLLWYNLCIVLYELRTVMLELREMTSQIPLQSISVHPNSGPIRLAENTAMGQVATNTEGKENMHSDQSGSHISASRLPTVLASPAIQRSTSAPASVSFSRVLPMFFGPSRIHVDEDAVLPEWTDDKPPVFEDAASDVHSSEFRNDLRTTSMGHVNRLHANTEAEVSRNLSVKDEVLAVEDSDKARGDLGSGMSRLAYGRLLMIKIFHRVKYAPLTYASIVGFSYSLLAQKYNWTMPYTLKTSVKLISQGAIGMAIFLLGMSWAYSGRLISGGFREMGYGMIIRFLAGPIIMAVTSVMVGLRGVDLRFAILQAVIPQGVISFVLAKEYNLNVDLFCTAYLPTLNPESREVIFQLLVFVPIAIAYYSILEI